MIKEQREANRIATIFTITLIMMPILIYSYCHSREWIRFFGLLCEFNFILLICSGILGTKRKLDINYKIESDILSKLQSKGIDVEKDSFDVYKINKERQTYTIDFNSIPSDTVQIDTKTRVIRYI